ncbi:MAG: outer rane adhesin like protein [Microvirga sp.]|jgi:hypothetical protein|nr:outer rane adhesin like protein [Microvirga sp.]
MAAFSGLDNNPAFTEDDPAVVLDGDAVVLGVFNYEGATLALKAAGGAAADHVFDGIGTLSLSDGQVLLTETQAGEAISIPVGSFTQIDGELVITFNAEATEARVNSVLQQLTYANSSQRPPSSVTISYTFDDGQAPASDSVIISITAVNDQPALDFVTAEVGYEPGAPALALSPSIAASDLDSETLGGAEVRIAAGFVVGDVLSADTAGTSIVAIFDSSTHVLTLSGVDTLANYSRVLASVSFSSTNPDPTDGGAEPARTIEWQVGDGS